jgi:serine/threonine protein kinase
VSVPSIVIVTAVILTVILMKRKNKKIENTEIPLKEIDKSPEINKSQEIKLVITTIPEDEITLGNILGSGHFGSVYKGKWGGTEVALKKLDKNAQGLEEEINILGYKMKDLNNLFSQLNHPHILRLLGVTNKEGEMFMVTELVRKGSLDNFLKENKSLTPFQLLQMALQVASGMRYLEKVY